MSLRPLPARCLVAYASAGAFSENTIRMMNRLGYRITLSSAIGGVDDVLAAGADLFLVDERRLAEGPPTAAGTAPIVLLTGPSGTTDEDSRIVGAVIRPAGLHDLYRVVEQVLEERPRSMPRVATDLPGECRRQGSAWKVSIRSLSENGCLIRTAESVPLGSKVQLSFPLPPSGLVHVWAEIAYQILPEFGLVFSSTSPEIRRAIGRYVTETLLRDPACTSGTR